jgi:uncharacterized protein (DUF1778 family)
MSASPVIGIRLNADDRAEIDRRAGEYRMTRSEYMIRAALEELPGTISVQDRVAETERRLDELERAAMLGAFS